MFESWGLMNSMDPALPTSLFLPAASLWKREVVRFVRQKSRVVGALGTPVVFWLLIGSGMGRSFQPPGAAGTTGDSHFLKFAFPGTMALILLFTAIFAMISIIEDRKSGFLQAVIGAPARRLAIVIGKTMGSTTLAVGQATLFLAFAPLAGVPLTVPSAFAVIGALVLVSLGLSGLGFLVAWPMESTQGFHAVMNLGMMPLWLLSGAFFPASGASRWLAAIMAINPLTYGVSAIRHCLDPKTASIGPSFSVSLLVTLAFATATIGISVWAVERRL